MEQTINDRMQIIVDERFKGNKAAFAKAIDLSPTAISSYLGKQRRSKPSVDMVTNIVVNLGIDPMWLLTGKETEKAPQPTATNNITQKGKHNTIGDFFNNIMSSPGDEAIARKFDELKEEADRLKRDNESLIDMLHKLISGK